jgi:site-specific recombinase XerC
MLLDTGVRRTGLVNLDLADLNLDVQRLKVLHGKGNKQRVVRFGARAKEVSGMWPATLPMVVGHESGGIVEKVGPGVHSLASGDHVILSWMAPCGQKEDSQWNSTNCS